MVLRSIPLTRSIWRWLVPASSKVNIVVCRCGFKTFNPVSLKSEGVKVTSCLVLTEAVQQRGLVLPHAALRVGEFEVAIRESEEVFVIDRVQHACYRLLDDFVLQAGNPEWALLAVGFGYVDVKSRLYMNPFDK